MSDKLILFSMKLNVNLGNSSSSWPEGFVTRKESELLTDIRDFTTLFYVILRRKPPNRLV